ncbi:hypothetical protein RSOLAG22IIIB_08359 [Rhizoctonia solani]|uniref:Stress-response A/B barrel domain-containing protein n=1 Tax=Rhizoctonia solani TaxID=456999 RepID=A0A0K6FSK3_9AGAM|nr:unnamed protein product [Rhizoctonia solani]CUA69235.1 hypothetical protein RSOLAG22IIIB_08359 [Rhizoctonia solani]
MIIHCVLFKINDGDEEYKKKIRAAIEAALRAVPTISKEAEFGPPISLGDSKEYDFALIARFPDRTALDAYAKDPKHEEAKEKVIYPNVKREETIVYDLEYGANSEA